ncbi:hypothetical protein [Mycolicibacterium mageritense]|uniref:Sporulation protein n=1 Tax=Mycolicibacterium mageritense TaxID=53462 RepID=A0AAI8U0Q6_MYCME|nr:hypothetical protein [Mycolicibacterium mageritense]TXI56741.1 MAG: hypothetical protein E6Q55_28075 [Mycolicibacterium mageritense]BDY32087.1 hypothetical protein hbim_06049 [Mycolicibacterium mageritense]GJJ19188.1 hypothetical protein MTY414_28610 [Mycolicibacterium mageritense]
MRLPDTIEELTADSSRVFGEPYQTPDGATVIPVSTVRSRDGRVTAKPLGVFVVKDGKPTWTAAVDHTRVALLGEVIGLVAATFATLAMVRRPPWPDVRADLTRRI